MNNIQELAARLVQDERRMQDEKWGEQNHPIAWWFLILEEEIGETAKAVLEGKPVRDELVQVAAVAVAMLESHLREETKNRVGVQGRPRDAAR